ncbi:RNA polymerase sigma-70 factor (ECF subfamily) [Rhodococcus sp. OK519]|uniref:sigma-70 family RNA polymerase sigma factor n=1 Tax=Rhodococcus sp. OK519 TaxID=2135729 RepID=UPI000D3A0ACF|nr:RNA polymerase sigma-70 factor (ECF subfamily) [Rhodococcus sp. OK519]
MSVPTLADSFESHRGHLLSAAYRLTGSVTDAEDAVQEAWIRLAGTDAERIDDLRAWLTTVVGRICLDRLRSATARRERYVGQWLPEPIVTDLTPSAMPDPLDAVVREEDNRLAALVVLDTLTADQRVAFVLHDGFGVPFAEIADMLSTSVASARQLASRARRAVADAPPPVPDAEHAEAVTRLLTAMAAGDLEAVLAALHPDAITIGDANGTTRTAVNVITGADHTARFFLGLAHKYGLETFLAATPARVNGQLGFVSHGSSGDDTHPGFPGRITGFTVRDGKVWAAYDIANPEKHRGIRLSGAPTPPAPSPTAPGTRHPS